MGRNLTALGLKWLSIWAVLLFIGLYVGPTPGQSAILALILGGISWWADRLLPFGLQGITRWAIDGGLAAVSIYAGQFLWPGPWWPFHIALLAGYTIGAVEIPIHFYLAARYGLRKKDDERDGIR